MAFIQFNRDSSFWELVKVRPTAFVLLAVIAQRARREPGGFDGLDVGEAYIGDYETYGVTRQIYRSDKAFLEKHDFLTIKPTTKGTVAKLLDKRIFDINPEPANHQANHQPTISQPSSNHQATTNNKDNNVNNGNKDETHKEAVNAREGKKQTEVLSKYGEEGSVKMTEENYLKLCRRYGGRNVDKIIQKMENWMLARNKLNYYSNHYRAMLNWLKDSLEKKTIAITWDVFREEDFDDPDEYNKKIQVKN